MRTAAAVLPCRWLACVVFGSEGETAVWLESSCSFYIVMLHNNDQIKKAEMWGVHVYGDGA